MMPTCQTYTANASTKFDLNQHLVINQHLVMISFYEPQYHVIFSNHSIAKEADAIHACSAEWGLWKTS